MPRDFIDRVLDWGRAAVRATCYYVVTFIEGEYESISEPFTTREAAALYSRGFVSGAGKLAISSVRAFVLPDEYPDLVEYRATGVDIRPALAAMSEATGTAGHGAGEVRK